MGDLEHVTPRSIRDKLPCNRRTSCTAIITAIRKVDCRIKGVYTTIPDAIHRTLRQDRLCPIPRGCVGILHRYNTLYGAGITRTICG